MLSRDLVLSTAAVFLFMQIAPAAVQAAHRSGHHSTGNHEHHWHPSHQDHQPRDHHKALHDRSGLTDLHNMYARIDSMDGLSDSDRQSLHEVIDGASSSASEVEEATAALEMLRAEAAGSISESRKAEIEQERATQLARIAAGQKELQTLQDRFQGQVQDRIEASKDLTASQKQKLRELVTLAKENKITLAQARARMKDMGIQDHPYAELFILFRLLVIIGSGLG